MNLTDYSPISLACLWQPAEQLKVPNARLKNWLLDSGSLTERLQARCHDFELQLLDQRQAEISLEENQQLNTSAQHILPNDAWQVREVLLCGNGQAWVYARSIIPAALCSGELAQLGNQPLGKLIFNDPRFVRQPFQLTQLTQVRPLAEALQLNITMPLWGRRSVFHFNQYAMSVAEIFLPQSPAYCDGQ